MISDNNYILSLIFFLFIFTLLNFTNVLNFLIYTELLWILLYSLFLFASITYDTNSLSAQTKLILILASLEFVILIYLVTQLKLKINKTKINNKINYLVLNTHVKKNNL